MVLDKNNHFDIFSVTAKTCGATLNKQVTYIESPNYPALAPAGMCMFNVAKCDSGVCQYK